VPTAAIVLLTPTAALVSLGALVPIAAAAAGGRRAQRVRAALRLPPPARAVDIVTYVALGAIVVLLGVAAAQPAVVRESSQRVRTDAQALFVLDVSRSMAAARPGSPTRLERARAAAQRLRASIPEVEAGVATLTDRVLPDLLPISDVSSFDRTLERSVQIEEPPPRSTAVRATSYAALEDVPAGNYFVPDAKKRVLVLLTDGETQPLDESRVGRAFAERGEPILLESIRFWNAGESIRDSAGTVDDAYRPDPSGALALANLASATAGSAFDENDLDGAATELQRALGEGPTRQTAVRERADILLGPLLALLALAPLAVLAARRGALPRFLRAHSAD
jgi:hypothetical protein